MNTHYITCRKCGASNTPTAQRCTACGTDLKSLGSPSAVIPGAPKRNVFGRINSWINNKIRNSPDKPVTLQQTQKATTWLVSNQPGQQLAAPDAKPPQTAHVSQNMSNLQVIAAESVLQPTTAGQHITDRYIVRKLTKHPTGTTLYYDAVDLICPKCNRQHESSPQSGVCLTCSTPLNAVLIHERQQLPALQIQPTQVKHLLNLAQSNHP
ncbi:MAG: zinc ribbon domain-containing protein, partial [Anaerolineales bacterium]